LKAKYQRKIDELDEAKSKKLKLEDEYHLLWKKECALEKKFFELDSI
jgi:hypothetical protein